MKLTAFEPDGIGGVRAVEIDEPDHMRVERERMEWLLTVREKYAALQDDLAQARAAFLTLKARYDALESWARTKGYTG